jgi:RimJ/RimL family protein N-acetyltransferase
VWHRLELKIYTCPADRVAGLPRTAPCRRDRWEDLQACEAWSYGQMTRDEYLAHLEERRRAGGHHLYSLVEHGVLVHYGWVTSRQERAADAALGLVFKPPPGSAALWDYFTHPDARGRGLYRDTLWQCMHDAVEIDGALHVFIYVYSDNSVSRRAIEKAGFEYYGSLVLERRFGHTRRYAITAGEPIDVRPLSAPHAPIVETRRCESARISLPRTSSSNTEKNAIAK